MQRLSNNRRVSQVETSVSSTVLLIENNEYIKVDLIVLEQGKKVQRKILVQQSEISMALAFTKQPTSRTWDAYLNQEMFHSTRDEQYVNLLAHQIT